MSDDMTRADAEANERGRGAPLISTVKMASDGQPYIEVSYAENVEPMTCPECLGTGYLECVTCTGEGYVDSVESESDAG